MIDIVDDTKICVADGRGFIPVNDIKEKTLVYYINEIGGISIREISPSIIIKDQPIIQLTFDTGDHLEITQNVKTQVRGNKEFKSYQQLGYDSLALFERHTYKNNNHAFLFYFDNEIIGEHKLIAQYHGIIPSLTEDIHHIDHDPTNNNPSNLVAKDRYEHHLDHMKGMQHYSCVYSHADLERLGINLAKELGRRFTYDEYRERGYPLFSKSDKFRGGAFGSFENFAYWCAEQAGVRNDNIPTIALKSRIELEKQGYETRFIERDVEILITCEYCGFKKWKKPDKRRSNLYCSRQCSNKSRGNHKLIMFIDSENRSIYQINLPNLIVGGWAKENLLETIQCGLIVC